MKEIKTFDELWNIQDEKWKRTCSLDLLLMRVGYRIIDGIVFLIGADCKEDLELFYMSRENYNKLAEGEKDYLKNYYGVE